MKSLTSARHAAGEPGVWPDMRHKGTGPDFESALGDFVRKIVRDELRLRQEVLETIRAPNAHPQGNEPDELLTVDQVAQILKVIPDTVRTWIQSGALKASRPGNGTQPGRKYRVRRADLDAFLEGSQSHRRP